MVTGPQDPDLDREREIFLVALDIPAGQGRDSFLEFACGGDPRLRSRVEHLLATDQENSILGTDTLSSVLAGPPGDPGSVGSGPRWSLPYSGDYEVGDTVARGGMGTIYRGIQSSLGRTVALKVMHDTGSPDSRHRFRLEAETLGRLNHPNIVPIHDLVRENGVPVCFSMKLVEGRNLQQILDRLREKDEATLREFPLARLLTIYLKVCDAISFAHSRGVLHRDLKPENIMVGDFGEVLVMDWGLAKQKDEAACPGETDKGRDLLASSVESGDDRSFLATLEGSVMGTPRYMSPEQAKGHIDEIDEQSDVFSLGGILYALLTLHPPVEGSTLLEILGKVSCGEITPPTRFGSATAKGNPPTSRGETLPAKDVRPLPHLAGGRVPAALSAVAMKALALEKSRRYASVADLGKEIEAYLNGFATQAEEAGGFRQVLLLMTRHKAVTASLALIFLIASVFVALLAKSEREARANAHRAETNETIAKENADVARRAYADAQIEVADSARRESDLSALSTSLAAVPEELRDQRWHYLSDKRTETRRRLAVPKLDAIEAISAIPGARAWFCIADRRGVVVILNVETGEIRHRIETPYRAKVRLGVSTDGTLLAVSSEEADSIAIHSIKSGANLRNLAAAIRHPQRLIFSPTGGELLVVADPSKNLGAGLLDLDDGTSKWHHPGYITSAAFSLKGERLFFGSIVGRSLAIVDPATGKVESSIRDYVTSIATSPNLDQVAVGLFTGEVLIIRPGEGMSIRRGQLHQGTVSNLLWTNHGNLVTFGNDGTYQSDVTSCRLWNPWNSAQKATFFSLGFKPKLLAWDPLSGNLLVLTDALERHHLPVDLETSRIVSVAEQGWSARFLSDTQLLARKHYNLRLYDVTDPAAPIETAPGLPDAYALAATFPPEAFALGKRLEREPFTIKHYLLSGGLAKETTEVTLPAKPLSLEFDPTGRWVVATMDWNAGMVLVDLAESRVRNRYPGSFQDAVFAGNPGESGNLFAIQRVNTVDSEEGDTLIVHRTDGLEAVNFRRFSTRLQDLAASNDRSRIALADSDGNIRILRADNLEELHRFRAHDSGVSSVAFHPSLPVLASGSSDGSVKVWEYEQARLLATHYGSTGAVIMLDFSPNGKLLVAECQDKATRIYDLGAAGVLPAAARVK